MSEITIPDGLDWITFEDGFLVENGKRLVGYFKSEGTIVIVPENVMGIGNGAFSGGVLLKKIVIPNSVGEILLGAFDDCSSDLALYVSKDSHAEQWAKDHDMKYKTF